MLLLSNKWHQHWRYAVTLLTLLLMGPPSLTSAAVSGAWSNIGQWSTSPFDNDTEYTFRFKTFDLVRLVRLSEKYDEAQSNCASTQSRLPRLEDLAGDLFQRYIFNNNDFIRVSLTKQVLKATEDGAIRAVQQWSVESGMFFLSSSAEVREKQLVELGQNTMRLNRMDSSSTEIGSSMQPTIILCVKERRLPKPPPPPPPPPPMPVAPSSSSPDGGANSPCACGAGISQAGGGGLDLAWPLAAVAFLGLLCLSLATALLVVCRTRRRATKAAAAAAAAAAVEAAEGATGGVGGNGGAPFGGKNGNSIPRTASSLMDYPGGVGHPHHHHHQHHHLHEKAHSLTAQATMPRRPRVIHHGQVHTNGYLTLGSIQARKQRELMHHQGGPHNLGLSEPPSPNHSIARSDYQHR